MQQLRLYFATLSILSLTTCSISQASKNPILIEEDPDISVSSLPESLSRYLTHQPPDLFESRPWLRMSPRWTNEVESFQRNRLKNQDLQEVDSQRNQKSRLSRLKERRRSHTINNSRRDQSQVEQMRTAYPHRNSDIPERQQAIAEETERISYRDPNHLRQEGAYPHRNSFRRSRKLDYLDEDHPVFKHRIADSDAVHGWGREADIRESYPIFRWNSPRSNQYKYPDEDNFESLYPENSFDSKTHLKSRNENSKVPMTSYEDGLIPNNLQDEVYSDDGSDDEDAPWPWYYGDNDRRTTGLYRLVKRPTTARPKRHDMYEHQPPALPTPFSLHRTGRNFMDSEMPASKCLDSNCNSWKYPLEEITALLEKSDPIIKSYFKSMEGDDNDLKHRSSSTGISFCTARQVSFPENRNQQTRNKKGVWRTIINQEKAVQQVKGEVCVQSGEGSSCNEGVGSIFTEPFKVVCEQRYIDVRMAVMKNENEKYNKNTEESAIEFDTFEFPSCCVCVKKEK